MDEQTSDQTTAGDSGDSAHDRRGEHRPGMPAENALQPELRHLDDEDRQSEDPADGAVGDSAELANHPADDATDGS